MKTVPAFDHLPPEAKAVKPASPVRGERHFDTHLQPQDDRQTGRTVPVGDVRAEVRTPRVGPDTLAQLSHAAVDALFGAGATIYPQSLAVVGYLSMANTGESAPAQPSASVGSAVAVLAGSQVAVAPSGMPGGDPVGGQCEAAMPSYGMPGAAVAGTGPAGDGVDELRAALASEAAPQWLAKRLSIVGSEQGAVIYLRDFRLAESQRGAVVDALREQARKLGQPLARIVVNGQECWRADGAQLSGNQGVTEHVG